MSASSTPARHGDTGSSASASTVSAPTAAAQPGSVPNADAVAVGSSAQVCGETLVDFFKKWELSEYVEDFKKAGYAFVNDLKDAVDNADDDDLQVLAALLNKMRVPERRRLVRTGVVKDVTVVRPDLLTTVTP